MSCFCLLQEEVTKLRAQVDEVIKDNERLRDEITRISSDQNVVSQTDR